MQYFLGYSSFTDEPPFDASLFVEFRKRLGMENLNAINEKIVALKTKLESSKVKRSLLMIQIHLLGNQIINQITNTREGLYLMLQHVRKT